jgi:F0F1-type ATP synthase membrane subunit b/b'
MEALGINFIWISAYIVIFGVLYFFARKFVAKVLTTTEERKNLIEDGLKNAKEAETVKEERLKEADVEKQKLIQETYKQAQVIIETAKTKEKKIIDEAVKKADAIIKEASVELESLKVKSKQDGLHEAKEVISLVVKKAFDGFKLDKKTEEELIEKSLKSIK